MEHHYPELCPEKGYIFRITHAANVEGLLRHGGLHCANAKWQDPRFVSIGLPNLIDNRTRRNVPLSPDGTLSDYVPFYFTPFSMMLYNIHTGRNVKQRDNSEIVILVSSIYRLREHNLAFLATDGHAYMVDTKFYSGTDDFTQNIDWDILQRRDFKTENTDPGKQQRYQAEVLVHKYVPLDALRGIICSTDDVRQKLQTQAETCGASIAITKHPRWYF